MNWYYFGCTVVWFAVFALTLDSQLQQRRRMDAITDTIAILSSRSVRQQHTIALHAALLASTAAELDRKENRA